MARNGSGTMSIVNSFTPSTTISSSEMNENFDDIATELTNSVAKDGQTVMTGQLKAANGTNSAPSMTFGSDLNTGAYRSAADSYAVAAGGTKVLEVTTSGVDAASGNILQGGFILVPPGAIMDYAGSSAPDGWLLCFGQAVSRTTYAALFTAIGTTFGAGDESTTFNLPDLRGRVSAGKDDMGGTSANRLTDADDGLNGDTLGDTGGAETQVLVQDNLPDVTLEAAAAGAHRHLTVRNTTSTGNDMNSDDESMIRGSLGVGDTAYLLQASSSEPDVSRTTEQADHTHDVPTGGSDTAFGIVQPTIILNKIIKY